MRPGSSGGTVMCGDTGDIGVRMFGWDRKYGGRAIRVEAVFSHSGAGQGTGRTVKEVLICS